MDTDNSVVFAGGEGKEGMGGNWWWTVIWLGVVNSQDSAQMMCAELCTWKLCNFVNQYHPNNLNKQEKIKILEDFFCL